MVSTVESVSDICRLLTNFTEVTKRKSGFLNVGTQESSLPHHKATPVNNRAVIDIPCTYYSFQQKRQVLTLTGDVYNVGLVTGSPHL